MKRKISVVLLSLMFLFSIFTCASFAQDKHTPEDPLVVPIGQEDDLWGFAELTPGERGGRVTYAAMALPKTFNGLIADETSSSNVTNRIMGGGVTDVSPSSGKTVPAGAKRWEVSADGLTYTFYLRKMRFSDGEPVTADDFVFTFNNLIANEDVDTDARDVLKVCGKLPTIEKIDDYTIQFTTPCTYGPFVRNIGFAPYPEHLVKDLVNKTNPDVPKGTFNSAWGVDTAAKNPEQIVGAGPFKLKEFTPAQQVILERNPYYWKVDPEGTQLPYLDGYIVLKVEDLDVSLLKFKNHETDLLGARAEDIPFLLKNREKEGWNVIINKGPKGAPRGTDFLTFNWDTENEVLAKVFSQAKFRRAISHAVNREDIVNIIFNGLAVAQDSVISQLSPYYNPKAGEVFPKEFDLKKAASMLDELGLKDTDGDGIRELPNGEPLKFVCMTNKGNTQRVDIGNIIAEDLKKIGVQMVLNPIKFNQLVQRLLSAKYEAVIIGLVGDPIEPSSGDNVYKSDGSLHFWHFAAKNNPTEYEKKVDELLENGKTNIGYENRHQYYDEWQILHATNVPLIYTADDVYLYAHEEDIQNTETFGSLASFATYPYGHTEYVWRTEK